MEIELEETTVCSGRLQNILQSLSKCKIEFERNKAESKKLREINTKLDLELKDSREAEKSHRYRLTSSREMIGNLQETVSQLVYLKRDVKKLNDEIISKDAIILGLAKDKESMTQNHNATVHELRAAHEKQMEEITIANERKIQEIQQDFDMQVAELSCVIEELRAKNREQEATSTDKMNRVALDHEEEMQRSAAQVGDLQAQLSRQAAQTDANIATYRRRLEELEEKLKQSQYKQYLAQSAYPSGPQVERPNPIEQGPYQVPYYGNRTQNVPKNKGEGLFIITKKKKF